MTSLILDRLAVIYQKPMFFIEGDMGGGEHVFGIRDYMSSEDWRKLYGVDAPLRDNSLQSGSGPEIMLDGVSKPDFLLPDSMYATSCNSPDAARDPRTFAGFQVPPCYGLVGSQSEPVAAAAGLAAVLRSVPRNRPGRNTVWTGSHGLCAAGRSISIKWLRTRSELRATGCRTSRSRGSYYQAPSQHLPSTDPR